MLLAFNVSQYVFNTGNIGLSVPLVYPVLLYFVGRMLWIGFRGAGGGIRPRVPVKWLAIITLFLIAFRGGLNIQDSSVIDVGYSGVIGADRTAHAKPIYGNFPHDNKNGDTYGPVAYYSYMPFEAIWPWHGKWDDLPAAHAAAIFFDLLTIVGLFLLGRRLRPGRAGRDLGVVFAFAWTVQSYPHRLRDGVGEMRTTRAWRPRSSASCWSRHGRWRAARWWRSPRRPSSPRSCSRRCSPTCDRCAPARWPSTGLASAARWRW